MSVPNLLHWPIRDPIPYKHRWHGLFVLFAVAFVGSLLWHDLALAQPQPGGAADNFNSGSCTAGVFTGIGSLLQGAIGLFDAQAGADACGMVQATLAVLFFITLGIAVVLGFGSWRNGDLSGFINPMLLVLGLWVVVTLLSKLLLG